MIIDDSPISRYILLHHHHFEENTTQLNRHLQGRFGADHTFPFGSLWSAALLHRVPWLRGSHRHDHAHQSSPTIHARGLPKSLVGHLRRQTATRAIRPFDDLQPGTDQAMHRQDFTHQRDGDTNTQRDRGEGLLRRTLIGSLHVLHQVQGLLSGVHGRLQFTLG